MAGSCPIPRYLEQVYWWAYVHPNAVQLFEREWLVNLILFGNYGRLRDAALAELGADGHRADPAGRLRLRQSHAAAGAAACSRCQPGRRGHPADPVEEPGGQAAGRRPDRSPAGRFVVAGMRGRFVRPGAAVLPPARAAGSRAARHVGRGHAGGEAGRQDRHRRLPPAGALASPAPADDRRVSQARTLRDGPVGKRNRGVPAPARRARVHYANKPITAGSTRNWS